MLNLDNISKFITFTIDLFNNEFSSYIDYVDSCLLFFSWWLLRTC